MIEFERNLMALLERDKGCEGEADSGWFGKALQAAYFCSIIMVHDVTGSSKVNARSFLFRVLLGRKSTLGRASWRGPHVCSAINVLGVVVPFGPG